MGLVLPPNPYRRVGLGAVKFLVKHLDNCIEKPDIIALGPLTKLAELVLTRPDLVHSINRLYIMGGAVDVQGNIFESSLEPQRNVSEWNVYCDPTPPSASLTRGCHHLGSTGCHGPGRRDRRLPARYGAQSANPGGGVLLSGSGQDGALHLDWA